MAKIILTHGASSGILATLASLMYATSYKSALGSNFSSVVSTTDIVIACTVGSMLIAVGYLLLARIWPGNHRMEAIFNLFLFIFSFISILGPFSAKLPLDIEAPELLPGLTIPMHFFPILSWLVLRPFFLKPNAIF